MKEELQTKLIEDFRYMFEYLDHKEVPFQPICFGIETMDGWEPLLRNALEEMAKIDEFKEIRISQIKEKFGTLRLYFDSGEQTTDDTWKKFHEIVTLAEIKSGKTCEKCGDKGKLRGRSWLVTLCDKCNKEKEGA